MVATAEDRNIEETVDNRILASPDQLNFVRHYLKKDMNKNVTYL